MLHHLLLCWFCLFLHVVCQPGDKIYSDTDLVDVPVIIFNAFPRDNVRAFILFEEARVDRIPYGTHAYENVLLQANDDYLFEYRKTVNEGIPIEVFCAFMYCFFRGRAELYRIWIYSQYCGQTY